MFHNIPEPITNRMNFLQSVYQKQLEVNTIASEKLCPIPPETGKFISLVAACSPKGLWLELGTGAGYSTLWLSLACRELNTKIITFEQDEKKIALAEETFASAQINPHVELIRGNLLEYLPNYREISFCFLDTSKDIYQECYDLVLPNLLPGGVLLIDNTISHQKDIEPLLVKAVTDKQIDALLVPIGKGVLMCRKLAPI